MKKFFSIFAAVLFAGSMMAETVTLKMEDYAATSFTGNGITVSTAKNTGGTEPAYNATGKDLRIYAKGSITISAEANITAISFTISTQGKKRLAPLTVNVGTVTVKGTPDFTATWIGSAKEVIFTVGDKADYGTDGNSKAGQLDFTEIEVTLEEGSAPAVSTPVITGDASFYETAEISIACSTEGAKVYYTLDGAEPTAESALYAAPFEINATTTVKAIAIKGEDKSAVAEKTFTKATVLTVAQALALDLSTPVANQYVEGIVSKVESFNSTYGSITYWISDNGEQANELEVYGGLAMNGEKFEAQDDLAVGDKVVVFGTLKDYSGTKEFDKNNYLVAFEPAGIVVSTCDWDNIEWLGDGSPEQTFGSQFKVCKDGTQPGVVNIQKPGWAAETGIYLTFPSAAFGEISLPENKYVKQGAGIVFYLSAFTAKETEVSVMCEGNEIVFTVYNDKGTDEATALINTKPEVKAVKTVINGQVVIIRDGKMINVLGVQL